LTPTIFLLGVGRPYQGAKRFALFKPRLMGAAIVVRRLPGAATSRQGLAMREHYKLERRASAALDFIAALAIGLTLAMLGLAYFDILWS
jgi:hypothetical protein